MVEECGFLIFQWPLHSKWLPNCGNITHPWGCIRQGYRRHIDNGPLLPPYQTLTTSVWATTKDYKKKSNK